MDKWDVVENVLKRGPITYYSITYEQHKNFYDFFGDGIVEGFLNSAYSRYNPGEENKIQGYAEIINQQQGESMIIEITTVWLTNMYTAKYFNGYVKSEIRNGIVKRIIINGQTSSSCFFKRFNRLTVITTSVEDANKLFAS